MKYTSYVNVFQGQGELDLPKPEGIAAKWFFIKAGTGNTSPAAMLPFGAMSVAPYSGGYPTGYGDHYPNSFSRPRHFEEGKKLYGFAHIQQSGTGAIGYYYNYLLVTPRYPASALLRLPEEEAATPGYYTCKLEDITCELTASARVALHKYTFAQEKGEIVIDLSHNDLHYPGLKPARSAVISARKTGEDTLLVTLRHDGIFLYFALRGENIALVDDHTARVPAGKGENLLAVAVSLRSEEKAMKALSEVGSFEETKKAAEETWEAALSAIEIETRDEKIREIFYSNLYHSLIKPADWAGESFIFPGDGPFFTDFATFWDMYKTALPLIFLLYKEEGEGIVESLLKTGEALGELPNSIGLNDQYLMHASQARMLGAYALLTAYRYGVKMDAGRMLRVIESDMFAENKKDFTVEGKCRSHTWMLDMADCAALTAEVARERGELSLAEKLEPLAAQWKKVYDPETGLLKADSNYYEGTLYNYSFRQMVKMDERIALAGGKEKFVGLLDAFFGYGAPDVTLPTDPVNEEPVREGMKLGRFEGFNNESDTEAPFSYVYAGRHDRSCEIIRAGMKYMFTTGRGGIPGNNDSGALSSYYVLMAVGLFPVAGQDLFILASPFVDQATLHLASGKTLEITVENNAEENIYVEKATFNGEEVKDFFLPAHEIMKGGKLHFVMKK